MNTSKSAPARTTSKRIRVRTLAALRKAQAAHMAAKTNHATKAERYAEATRAIEAEMFAAGMSELRLGAIRGDVRAVTGQAPQDPHVPWLTMICGGVRVKL